MAEVVSARGRLPPRAPPVPRGDDLRDEAHEAARLAMTDKLSSAIPAPRYNVHKHERVSA